MGKGLNGWTKWIALGITVMGLSYAVISAIADTRIKVAQVCEDVKVDVKPRLTLVESAIVEQRTDIKWIRKELERQNP